MLDQNWVSALCRWCYSVALTQWVGLQSNVKRPGEIALPSFSPRAARNWKFAPAAVPCIRVNVSWCHQHWWWQNGVRWIGWGIKLNVDILLDHHGEKSAESEGKTIDFLVSLHSNPETLPWALGRIRTVRIRSHIQVSKVNFPYMVAGLWAELRYQDASVWSYSAHVQLGVDAELGWPGFKGNTQ